MLYDDTNLSTLKIAVIQRVKKNEKAWLFEPTTPFKGNSQFKGLYKFYLSFIFGCIFQRNYFLVK